ncbi:MAG: STAS domain-containing protein [Planctomycetota bacterium]
MNISVENYGRAVVLNIFGDLNEDALSVLQETIMHHLQRKDVVDVVLNMAESPFMDSAVLEYLLDLQDSLCGTFGSIRFVNCDENVRSILEVTRLEHEFGLFEDIDEAVKATRA